MESELSKMFRYYRERQFKETPLQTMIKLNNMENKYTLDKPENTVFCSTNTPEVQEFIELASVKVKTDNIDEQKTTPFTWIALDEDGTV
jgi:hypothetical protein